MVGHRISEMGVMRWFRVPRCYVWEETKWINEKEKSEDGKRDQEKERREM